MPLGLTIGGGVTGGGVTGGGVTGGGVTGGGVTGGGVVPDGGGVTGGVVAGVTTVVWNVESPPGCRGGVATTGRVGGGGVVGGVRTGRLAAVKVATVAFITVSLALPSPPLTFGRPVEERPPVAAARIAGLMTPEFTTLPVTVAKLFGPTLMVCVPLVTATLPVRT